MVTTFATSARTNMDGLVAAFARGEEIKIFGHNGGWSVQCPSGVLCDAGVDEFKVLEPLVEALKVAGIGRLVLEP
jgi:hypothetical protein